MSLQICVDSGIAIKLVLPEVDTNRAVALWQHWLHTGAYLIAPPLFPIEITAVCRKHVYRGTISAHYGEQALQTALQLNVSIIDAPQLHQTAWHLATRLNRPTAYDAHYLALAQILGAEFWTADERLYNSARNDLPWVKWLGNFAP